ncbi:MAG: hypothetical protein QOE79_2249 [Sphingomonadales bacterium]|jgi:hypothetical protein|nr:hypothetical protein [Sphingomonadales bacterium]
MISTKRLALGGAVIAVAFSATTAALAQDAAAPTPAAAPPETQCELHVWPAERFQAITTGWLSGFGVVGAVAEAAGNADKNKTNRTQIASALEPQGQLDALTALELTNLLKSRPARVIVHVDPLDRKTINKISTRRAESASPCYSELIVADVLYQKAAIYGRSLKTLFMYRDFGAARDKPWIYKAWGGNGLKIFPPKPGEDVQAANDELVTTFKKNFEEFAHNEVSASARRTMR